MAGGKGTRLKPLTCSIPKPMVPIFNKPTMEYTIDLLKKHDIKNIAVTMAHLPTIITDYFQSGEKWNVNLKYYVEEVPLGTGGSVKNAEEFINETIIVLSGDSLADIDIQKAVRFHREKKSKATLILKNEPVPIEYGVVITDDNGRITRFLEKPSWGEVFSNTINTGMYILEPEVLHYYQKGENFDFSKDLFPRLLADDIPMYGYITKDYWCDVGAINSYIQTHFDILEGKVNLDLEAHEIEKGVWIGEGTQIGSNVSIIPPVYIGKNCTICEGSTIGGYSVIGDHCKMDKRTSFKRSIIWNNTTIGQATNCSGAVVCNDVEVKEYVELFENAIIGEGSSLQKGVIVKPDIKLWPNKRIEENTIVNQNLVWGTKASKTIFGFRDISGQMNIDISPEFSSRLGAAFASALNQAQSIIVSSDSSNASSMIKRALITGIHSTGSGTVDIGEVAIPITRFAVKHFKANGGIYVRKNHDDNLIHIELVDQNGANIQRNLEREIENLFNREDFKRCNTEQIKSVITIENFKDIYIQNGLNSIKNLSSIKRKNPHILISSKSESTQRLAATFLEGMGCTVHQNYGMKKQEYIKEYFTDRSTQKSNPSFDFGGIISEDGEKLILIDGKGRVIEQEKYDALVAMVLLKANYKNKLVAPYTSPYYIETMAKNYNVEVVRVKSNPADMMNNMLRIEDDQSKASQYILNYNAIWAIGRIIDFLVEKNIKLEHLVDELPEFYFIKESIPCSWEDKGRIIRQLVEEHQHNNIELFEGVKIRDERGWALILPDSEKPIFNIYTEGFSEEYAQELSKDFKHKVKNLLKNQGR